MFTSAVHAAPPHNAAMNIRFFLGGLRPPNPSRGWGHGETGFPHAPAPAAYFHVSRPCGSAAHQRDENNFLGGRSPPKPSQGPGPGCAGLRPASAEVWGNPVSPPPSPRAYFHVIRPCGCAAQRRNEHEFVLGRAAPSQTLPRAGAWGNPVSPHPSSRTYVHVRPPCMRLAPHPDGMNIRLFLGWLRPPRPSHRVGDGEPRFPHTPASGLRPPKPSRGRGYGGTGFPHVHVRCV